MFPFVLEIRPVDGQENVFKQKVGKDEGLENPNEATNPPEMKQIKTLIQRKGCIEGKRKEEEGTESLKTICKGRTKEKVMMSTDTRMRILSQEYKTNKMRLLKYIIDDGKVNGPSKVKNLTRMARDLNNNTVREEEVEERLNIKRESVKKKEQKGSTKGNTRGVAENDDKR